MPESNANAQQTSSNEWTLQAFTQINNQPWMALQEHAADGSVTRQLTGFEDELQLVARQERVTPRFLAPTSQQQFFASSMPNKSDQDYELGRQFAADRTHTIHQNSVPFDLDQFTKGIAAREFEAKVRADQRESLVAAFELYALDTGFETTAQARDWAEREVEKIYPSTHQAFNQPDALATDVRANAIEQRRSAEPEQQREENATQSYGMTI